MQTAQAGSGEIERDRWSEFLDDFSKRNRNRPTRLEIADQEIGSQEVEEFFPLVGVSFEGKGSAAGSVVIILGNGSLDDLRQMEHTVSNTKRIVPIIGTRGFEDGLGFESEDGARTLLLFEELPELPPQ